MKVEQTATSYYPSSSSSKQKQHAAIVVATTFSSCWDDDAAAPAPFQGTVTPEHTIEQHQHAADDDGGSRPSDDDMSLSPGAAGDDDDDCWIWTPPPISLNKTLHDNYGQPAAGSEMSSRFDGAISTSTHDWNNPALYRATAVCEFASTMLTLEDYDTLMGEEAGEAAFIHHVRGSAALRRAQNT